MKLTIKIFVISLLILIGLSLTVIWFSTSNNENNMNFNSPKSSLSYENAIDTINKNVIELTAVSDLLGNDNFLSVITYSDEYLAEALKYLANPSKGEQSKIIAIYSMQNLNYTNYLSFFDSCTKMYKEGKITENAILHVIIPGTDWNNKIINSFYKSRVRKTLKELKSINSNSEDLIGVINQALAGKLWWNRITR